MKKYIGQINSQNFVYPGNTLAEYAVEIIHDLKNESVSGDVTNFSATTVSSTSITAQFDYDWALNGAEPWITNAGELNLFSVHMMEPSLTYFKPFRCVGLESTSVTGTTTTGGTFTFTVTPSDMEVSSFSNGTYYFEIRMIGHRATLPICITSTISAIPVPSPTPSPSPVSPTPTPTPSPTPVYIDYKSGATINVTDTGWIKYDTSTSADVYEFVSSLGTHTITGCTDCSTIVPGIPFADVANFNITFCGNSCGVTPPTPSPTPSAVNYYYRLTKCADFTTWWTQQYPSGTFNSGDRVEGSSGTYYVISGSQTANPGGTLLTVTDTGLSGCP